MRLVGSGRRSLISNHCKDFCSIYKTLSFLVPMEENLGVRTASNQVIKCARSSSSVYSVQAAVGC